MAVLDMYSDTAFKFAGGSAKQQSCAETLLHGSLNPIRFKDQNMRHQLLEVPMRRVPSHENHVGISEKLRIHAHLKSGRPGPCGCRQN